MKTKNLTIPGTATTGQYANIGNATGTTPAGSTVSDENLSHYFGQVPGIMIVKKTNGDDAKHRSRSLHPKDGPVTWTYEVTNTGNVNLTNVEVTDNVTGVSKHHTASQTR